MNTSTKAEREQRRAESIETLRGLLHPGSTVYVAQSHVSRSGMLRHLSLSTIALGREVSSALDDGGYAAGDNLAPNPQDYELRSITWHVANALGWPLHDGPRWLLKVTGAGMDMHFYTVYSLSRVLFPNGFDESGKHVNDGGYALRYESI